jgi:hypothetical protein
MRSRGGELDGEHAGSREREPERQFEFFHLVLLLFLGIPDSKGSGFDNLGFYTIKRWLASHLVRKYQWFYLLRTGLLRRKCLVNYCIEAISQIACILQRT